MFLVDWLADKWRDVRDYRLLGEESRRRFFKHKVKRAKNSKFFSEEVQHLRRCGISITPRTNSVDGRFIRRLTDWWEATFIEKFLEDIENLLKKSALLSIVSLLAQVTIILSLFGWWFGRAERKENELFATWQIINGAQGDQSGVARVALERLLRNDFSLSGLYLKRTNLGRANLQGADLRGANLQEADLSGANLQKAYLGGANLQKADLIGVNLQEAYLRVANLQGADIGEAILRKADLIGANLQGTNLGWSDLRKADLREVNLQKADLSGADLQKAFMTRANLQEAYLGGANLQGADIGEAILKKADLSGANLQGTNLGFVDLINEQIKLACFWDRAIYKDEWNEERLAWVVKEPDNTKFIEELKRDKLSDPEKPPNCSRWDNSK